MSNYHESLLQKAFEFTPEDLSENRQGHLSPSQVERLRRRAGRLSLIIIGTMGILGVLTVLSARGAANEAPILLLCLGVPALITLAVTVGTTEAAIAPRVVTKRTGQAHLAYGMGDYVPPLEEGHTPVARRTMFGRQGAYRLIVDNQEFMINQDQYQAMQPGVFVAVYFVATIDRIVSVEALEGKAPLTTALPSPASPVSPFDDEGDVIRA
jgi:hypothetical protein